MENQKNKIRFFLRTLGPLKKSAFKVLLVIIASAFFESFGIYLLLPILQVGIEGTLQGFSAELFTKLFGTFSTNKTLIILSSLFLLVMSIKFLLTTLRIVMVNRLSWQLRMHWVNTIFKKYVYSRYSFIINNKQGELLNNLVNETHRGSLCIMQAIDFIAKIVLFCALAVTSFIISWQVTFALMGVALVLLGLSHKLTYAFAHKVGKKHLRLQQELSAHAAESIHAVRQIKTFGLQGHFSNIIQAIIKDLRDTLIRFNVIRELYPPLSELLVMFCIVGAIIAVIVHPGFDIKLFFPVIGFFAMISLRLATNLSLVARLRLQIISLFPSLALSYSLSSQSITEEDTESGTVFSHLSSDIVFEKVCFSYTGSSKNAVFCDLSLKIPYGKITAVVGSSGIGKSTLIDLILGLYQPQKGKIFINGQDIRLWKLLSWRQRIGFVSQDTFIFNTTIRDNIIFGKLDASEDEVIEAAKKAYAHDFIVQMPKGYDTVVGDRGMKLSGGQRQRIAIAMVIVRNPDFFIFDEATSALDHESEKIVQKAIFELGKKKTVLIVAHRHSSIEGAQHVIDLGRVFNDAGKNKSETENIE